MQKIKENKITIKIQIDKFFYEDLMAETVRRKISIPRMLTDVFYAYITSPENQINDYNFKK